MMCIGNGGGPLLIRLYFIRGGDRIWFTTWLNTAGWPVALIPLAAAYYGRRRRGTTATAKAGFFTITRNLAFTAGAAFVLVKQRFTVFTVNAVVLLTIGAGELAVGSSGDRPAGESKKEYVAAFLMTLGAAALYGALLPSIEFTYTKATQSLTYTLVLEFQMVMSLFATAVCTLGMLVNKDFQVITKVLFSK
nr:purine permease 3-like [Ipomoea batatas]